MGHRKKIKVITVDMNGKYEGLVVRMKSPSLGKLSRLMRAIDQDKMDTDMIDSVIDLIGSHLLTWTLEDEDGTELPATKEEVADLDLPMLMDISFEWIAQVANVDADLGKGSPSGDQFPGQPVLMEAL